MLRPHSRSRCYLRQGGRAPTRRVVTIAAALLLLAGTLAWSRVRPSNQRYWEAGQTILPAAHLEGNRLTIRNVRDFRYDSAGLPTARWENRTYDLDRVESVWLGIAPFERDNRGPAHSFLSFGFSDSQYVAISIEARREVGESYSLLKGMLRRYEIMYVIGDERDLIQLRTNHRDDDVYLYPVRTTPDKVRLLFLEMLRSANQLRQEPEFYNTLTNNCTTRILQHANRVATNRIPWGREVLLPGYADELALRLGLIDDRGTIEDVRARYLVNERAKQFANAPDFSVRIRTSPTPP